MDSCLMGYYVLNSELKNSCEFNPGLFDAAPSIYEVVRIEKGTPLFIEDHINRFFKSANLLNKEVTTTEKQILSRVKAVIEINHLQTGLIKFLYMDHPVAGNLFAAWVTPFFFPSEKTYKEGIAMGVLHGTRNNPNAKLSHQIIRNQADDYIKKNNVYEVLLVNQKNVVTEGSRSNLFFVTGGILFTAHHNLILEGITRSKIIDLAQNSGIDIIESEFTLQELSEFEAAFITGTSPKVLSVKSIVHHYFNTDNKVIKHLSEEYQNLITGYIKSFSW